MILKEINRILTDHIFNILFAPNDVAVKNLSKEGITVSVYKVEDVILDVALEAIGKIEEGKVLSKYNLEPKRFILVTIYRAKNTVYERFLRIWQTINEIAKFGIKLIFPVHPCTRKVIKSLDLTLESENLILVEPVSYFEIVALGKNAKIIITDSGGVQKEGFLSGAPCITPREETKWIEPIKLGFNHLVGVNEKIIIELSKELFFSKKEMSRNLKIYMEWFSLR